MSLRIRKGFANKGHFRDAVWLDQVEVFPLGNTSGGATSIPGSQSGESGLGILLADLIRECNHRSGSEHHKPQRNKVAHRFYPAENAAQVFLFRTEYFTATNSAEMMRLAALRARRRLLQTSRLRSSPCQDIRHVSAMQPIRAICADHSKEHNTASRREKLYDSASGGPKREMRGSTYVSNHFCLAPGEVDKYLDGHSMKFRRTDEHAIVEECPFCPPINGKVDNMYKLYMVRESGVFKCHRCSSQGSWFDFRKRVGYGSSLFNPIEGELLGSTQSSSSTTRKGSPSRQVLPKSENQDAFVQGLWHKYPFAKEYLNKDRGLSDEVLKKYGVGAAYFPITDDNGYSSHLCVTFPMYDGDRQLVRHKVRSIQTKSGMRLNPKGGSWGLFGLNLVPDDAEEVVLTEGEFDALSVYQATGRPSISLPNGASSLPIALLPALERFKTIFLWMDEDVAGQDGATQFSRKLGAKRCRSIRGVGSKDANDALREEKDLEGCIQMAQVIPHEGIISFEDIRDDVFYELANIGELQGLKSRSLPRLNNFLSGHRRGELTIFSGHTGVGKTTLLAQLALDYCMQGVPTLWGSFEVGNVRLAGRILRQFHSAHEHRPSLLENFDEWADRFSELPLHFMRYHGSNEVERVIEAMEYANYVHDCSHVILDNLQFMTSGQGGRGKDRFAVLDDAIGQIREFCTVRNAHVSLVVHPRKEDDDMKIMTASVFGTAKATQEADNVVILQKTPDGPVLDIRKNRFDGTLGAVSLKFDPKKLLFEELGSSGAWALAKGEVSKRKCEEPPRRTGQSNSSKARSERKSVLKPKGGKLGQKLQARRQQKAGEPA